MDSEVSFPRGGVKSFKRSHSEVVDNIFVPHKAEVKQISQTKRQKIVSPINSEYDVNGKSVAVNVESLTYQKLQEGMLILGCIRRIDPLFLEVELPGNVYGKIEVCNLSNAHIKYLKECIANNNVDETNDLQRLDKLYFIGQIIPTKVIQISRGERTKVLLSLDPGDINADLQLTSYKPGVLIWTAVSSKLDHGYVLDVGNKHCRVFLPFASTKQEFEVGQTIWCIIQKSEISSGTAIITVSAIHRDVIHATQSISNLHNIIPGMQFDFTITKILKSGLEGKLPNNSCVYINQLHLREPLQNLSKYKVGNTHKARLLYIEPITKLMFLTFRKIDVPAAAQHALGSTHFVTIISRTNGGVLINFRNGEKGFMPNKRIILSVSYAQATNIAETLKKKFKQGTVHQCRILSYNMLEKIYICTPEQAIINEQVFSITDLSIGELVKVKINRIIGKGLVVKLGKITGFLQNLHICSGEYSDNIKNSYSIGKTLQVKVWNINEGGVYFTNKKELIKEPTYFCKYEDAVVNNKYLGVVAFINKDGSVLVIFYGDLKGILPKPNVEVFVGQVILTIVVKKSDNLLNLSLDPVSELKTINIGESTDAVVDEIKDDCLIVTIFSSVKAQIPEYHLSGNLSLNHLLLDTYKIGDIIKNVLCIDKKELPILSLREALQYNKFSTQIGKYEDLEVGSLLRCFYVSHDKKSVMVSIPFNPTSRTVCVAYEDFIDVNICVNLPRMEPQQPLILKVLNIEHKSDKLEVTGIFSEVYYHDDNRQLDNIEDLLHSIERIRKFGIQNNTLLSDLQIGQNVECIIKQSYKSGYQVLINNSSVEGFANRNLCPGELYDGQNLQGTVIWINYQLNIVHVVLLQHIRNKINKTQDGQIGKLLGSTSKAKVLLAEQDFVIAMLQNEDTNQLIFLPTFIHENALFKKMNQYGVLENINVIISRKVDNFIIGIQKDFKTTVERKLIRNELRDTTNNGTVSKSKSKSTPLKSSKKNAPKISNGILETQACVQMSNNDVSSVKINKKSLKNNVCQLDLEKTTKTKVKSSDVEKTATKRKRTKGTNNIQEGKLEKKQCSKIIQKDSNIDKLHCYEKLSEEAPNHVPTLDDAVLDTETTTCVKSGFSSMKQFFTTQHIPIINIDDSDEEVVVTPLPKKKKKLSAAERAELSRLQEEEIRKKEHENADLTDDPKSPDQFDRLLLGNPNSSELWAKYMTYFVAATEFDKARAIARRALKTIDLNETIERFNIWVIFLRLENNHGDKNTFEEIFEEAVRCNEALDIYLEAIQILAESHKFEEMEEKIKKAKKKFKYELKMWITITNIYCENNMTQTARQFGHAALKVMQPNTRDYVNLAVQFALIEFRHGEIISAEALFETLIQNNPRRIDLWSTYIDQVINKTGDIDKARRIFDRAMVPDIPLKKKKSLFNKYKEFEIKYGDKETLKRLMEITAQQVGTY